MDELRAEAQFSRARVKTYTGISPPRFSSQMREMLSVRSIDASRSLQVRGNNVQLKYRPVGPASLPLAAPTESLQPVRPPPASTSSIRPNTHMDEEPLTVSGLLQSLGLSKCYINFQAEEMGDIDLKEMGIPMGPRKKILLAIKSRTFRWPP